LVLAGKTLIIGSGNCALATAGYLSVRNVETILAAAASTLPGGFAVDAGPPAAAAVETLPGARLIACRGFAGRFEVELEQNGKRLPREVSGIVIAEDARRGQNLHLYGLRPSESALSLSSAKTDSGKNPSAFAEKTVALLNGLREETSPAIFEEMLEFALELRKQPGGRIYFLTANLKVAAEGLEVLYREAKAAGIIFFKFTESQPELHCDDRQRVTIDLLDEITGHRFRLTPDVVVVDETLVPADELARLSEILQLDTDRLGFLQSDNVHRLPVATNRRGIFAAGAARAAMGPQAAAADALNAAGAVICLGAEPAAVSDRAEIDTGACIKCLTCFRLCPYRSVEKADRMRVATDACQGCGICAAECPRGAISMGTFSTEMPRQIQNAGEPSGTGAIVAFCCTRSAARAAELARCLDDQDPIGVNIVEVPCAGSIAVRHILAAFGAGAAGILVLSCHDGNCHSEIGNVYARQRTQLLTGRMRALGLDPSRIEIHTLAANMGREFAEITRRFAQTVRSPALK
jgi:quinone-modifying oxidoreductase subunit QmoB